MKKKKGFTLIELLAVIVIIGLTILVIYLVNIGVIGNAKSVLSDAEEKLVLEASELFAKEYRHTDNWKEYALDNNNSSFCVSLKTVINKGYYNASNKKIVDKADRFAVYFKVENGVYYKEVINLNSDNNPCVGYIGDSNLTNNSQTIDYKEGEQTILKLDVNTSKISDYEYNTSTSLDINSLMGNVEVKAPIYVALVMDSSGSMSGTKLTNALNAVKNMANSILESNPSSYIALVKYNDIPSVVRGFEHSNLDNITINTVQGGGTNTSGSMDITTRLFSKVDDKNALKYVVLLYDGEPTSYSYFIDGSSKIYPANSVYISNSGWTYLANEKYFDKVINTNIAFNNYVSSSNDARRYTITSANYLTSYNNNGNYPKLITIGYDFSQSKTDLKEASSKDEELCGDSDYAVSLSSSELIYSNTGEDGSTKLELVDNPKVLPFEYDASTNSLVSTNDNLKNTVAYGYLELDLTSSNNYYKVDFDISYYGYKYNYSSLYDYGLIQISESSDIGFYDKYSYCYYSGGAIWGNYNYNDPYSICYSSIGSKIEEANSINLKGGKKYYIHFYNINYTNTGNSYLRINSINVSDTGAGNVIFDTGFANFNGNGFATLSTSEESRVVYGFNKNGNGLSQSFDTYGKVGYSILPIDLTDVNDDDVYIAGVNTDINGSTSSSFHKSEMKLSSSKTKINSKSYYSSRPFGMNYFPRSYRSANNGYNYFLLNNNTYNYLHFYFDSGYSLPVKYNINSMSLYKRGDKLDDLGFDFNVNNNYDELINEGILKNDKNTNYYFEFDNNNLTSNNQEVVYSYAHSYIKIDLSDKSSDDYFAISTKYNLFMGYSTTNLIILSDKEEINNINSLDADDNYGSDILISGYDFSNNYSEERYGIVKGGSVYYVHFIFKMKYESSNSWATINNVNVYEASKVKDYSYDDVTHGDDYSFVVDDNSLVSSNSTNMTTAHSYVKIDLSKESNEDIYSLKINDEIFTKNYNNHGRIVLSISNNFPDYNLAVGSRGIISYIGGEQIQGDQELEHVQLLSGGKIYYVHFIFNIGNYNVSDDSFSIDNISLTKISGSSNYMDLSKVEVIKDGLVFSSDSNDNYIVKVKKGSAASSYLKVDLTNYTEDDEFFAEVSGSATNSKETNPDVKMIVNEVTDRQVFSTNITGICYYEVCTYEIHESKVLKGGKVYYIHLGADDFDTYSLDVTINSVKVSKVLDKDYYCYYESDSDSISNLYSRLSESIINSVPDMEASSAKVTLYAADNISIGDKNVTEVSYDIDFDTDTKIIDNNFNIKISEDAFNSCKDGELCTLDVDLFKKIDIVVYDKDNKVIKTITVDKDLPKVTINRTTYDTLN